MSKGIGLSRAPCIAHSNWNSEGTLRSAEEFWDRFREKRGSGNVGPIAAAARAKSPQLRLVLLREADLPAIAEHGGLRAQIHFTDVR
jgi:hypothetical protein